MKKVLLVCVCTAMLASCGQNSADYKKLKAENDSLRIENTKNTDELNDMLSTLNDIESDFQSIRDAENYLTIQQQTGGELNQSRRDQIKQNMQLISETLKKNKEQISQLEEKLKKSGIQSSALRKTIDRLSSELDQKATMIVALQEDLAKKNVRIQELDEMVSSLNNHRTHEICCERAWKPRNHIERSRTGIYPYRDDGCAAGGRKESHGRADSVKAFRRDKRHCGGSRISRFR